MKKIIIVHHSNQLGLGGTEKDMLLFCKYLDKDVFDVHALTRKYPVPPHREILDNLKSMFGDKKATARKMQHDFSRVRIPDFVELLGSDHVHFYTRGSLPAVMKRLSPQLLHVHHSGVSEPPISVPEAMEHVPIVFTINGFGFEDRTPHQKRVTRILFPSRWIKDCQAQWSKGDPRCGMLYCPIENPRSDEDLRGQLDIAPDTFVIGRVGRNADDIHDGISLRAYKRIECAKTLFLVLAAPEIMKKEAQDLGIRNIRYLEPRVDDVFLSRFYNTIDVLGHARSDGETFGCVIAEAMIHGKPVVTHRSHLRNAQAELVDERSGFVVEQHDWESYAGHLRMLMENKNLCLEMGRTARKRALENFEAGLVTKKLSDQYLEEIKKRGIPFPTKELSAV